MAKAFSALTTQFTQWDWQVGQKNGGQFRFIYARTPNDQLILIGEMSTPLLAKHVVSQHNKRKIPAK